MRIFSRDKLIIAFTCLSILLLTGCSFFADFFILNATDKNVTAIIKFSRPIEEYLNNDFSIQLYYNDKILPVNDKTKSQLTKRLNYTRINPLAISIDIPAKSTVLIGGSINQPIDADSISIIKDEIRTDYTLTEIDKLTKKTGGISPPFHRTCKIE